MTNKTDDFFMQRALELARYAAEQGEVPVGAVLVCDGEIIGEGYNQPISANDPTAHAEMVALRDAAAKRGNYRLPGTILYVTIEPCAMCVGAMVHARIEKLVYGASEPKAGVVDSNLSLLNSQHFNHRVQCRSGVMAKQAAELMSAFFAARRLK